MPNRDRCASREREKNVETETSVCRFSNLNDKNRKH